VVDGYVTGTGPVSYQPQAELYDPKTFLTTNARMIEERSEHTAILLSSGKC
jgi:hypothetical protein